MWHKKGAHASFYKNLPVPHERIVELCLKKNYCILWASKIYFLVFIFRLFVLVT